MLDAINRALEYTQPGEAQFRSDLKTQDAVLRNLETLGEAAKKLDSQTRALSTDTPWREIAGFRDVIAHDYLEVVSNHAILPRSDQSNSPGSLTACP